MDYKADVAAKYQNRVKKLERERASICRILGMSEDSMLFEILFEIGSMHAQLESLGTKQLQVLQNDRTP